jgi:hypothetical protein
MEQDKVMNTTNNSNNNNSNNNNNDNNNNNNNNNNSINNNTNNTTAAVIAIIQITAHNSGHTISCRLIFQQSFYTKKIVSWNEELSLCRFIIRLF